MKVYLAHYWESDEVVMTKAFAGLPTGEMVGFFITRAARLQMDRDMVQALKAGDAPES